MNNNLLSISIKLKRINSILIFLFIISFSITLSAPIITYGTQIFLLLPLVFFILIVNGGFKLNKLFYIIFLGLFIFTITYIQSTYLLYKEILWLQTVRIYFWIACCIIVYDSIIKLPISIIQNCIEKNNTHFLYIRYTSISNLLSF